MHKVIIQTRGKLAKKDRKIGIANAHEYLKDRFKISIKDGKFCLFEHVDQNPLFINNVGMASKIKRYIYNDKSLPPKAFNRRTGLDRFKHMGPQGT